MNDRLHRLTDRGLLESLLDKIEGLACEVRALRASVHRNTTVQISRRDLDRLGTVLPALENVFLDRAFTSNEVLEHATLAPLVGLSVKALGKLLLRGTKTRIDGYSVERLGLERNCALWRIVRTHEG